MRPTKAKLLQLYKRRTDSKIAELYGVSTRSVCGWRMEYGIATNPDHRHSNNLDEQTLRELSVVHTDAEIGDMLGISGRSVGNWRERFGILQRHSGRRRPTAHALDVDFFSQIDTEQKAYALGLLSADGYVCKSGKWIAISLQARDQHILADLRRAMGSSAPLRDKRSVGGFPGSTPQKVITFCSRKLVSDLARFGVVPRKSHSLSYPDIDQSLDRHFIRGIIDGDGYIGPRQFVILGTDSILKKMRNCIFRHTGQLLSESRLRGYQRLVGSRRDMAVLKWIYEDATIFLRRKHLTFLKCWS